MRKTHKSKLSSQSAKMVSQSAHVTINAGVSEGESAGPPTFEAVAYDGTKPVPGYTATPKLDAPYVLNLSGMTQGRVPKVNLDHKSAQRVGHLTGFELQAGKHLHVSGSLSAATPFRDEVASSAANNFPWEVSIEAEMMARRKIPAGKSAMVNGVMMQGPLYVFDKSVLTDIAFVSRGANEGNHVTIAASAAKDEPMNEFEKFAAKLGIDLDSISAEDKADLQQMFNAKQGGQNDNSPSKTLAQLAEAERANVARINKINEISVAAMREHPLFIENIKTLGELAIANGSSVDQYELELIRATRTRAGSFNTRMTSAKPDGKVYEAAICMMSGLKDIEKHYSEKTLDDVDRAGLRNNISLQQLLMQVASENGYSCRAGERVTVGNIRAVLEYAFPPAHARMGGFSTVNLPGILGNVANKMILAGYMEQDQTWREISRTKPVSNFYTHTHYRMLDDLEYEEVGSGGEIKHGTLGQESYTSQAKTYGKLVGLTRTQIINDDLGAFDDIRERLGKGAAKKFNKVFWSRFMAALPTLFPVNKSLGNYIDGTSPTSLLGTDGAGLQLGLTAFRKMTSPTADGAKEVGNDTMATILLVPPELEFNATTLYANADSKHANIHAGKYRPVIQNRLSNTAYTGNSSTQWFLFGDDLKPMLVTLLNGNATPIIESSDADFDTLGILFRGYHDFGCDPAESLSGVMSKGAAA